MTGSLDTVDLNIADDTSPQRVLIVDDDRISREIIIDALSSKNLDIDQADDGRKALELLNKNRYDLVLCDIVMPGIDGIEMLKRARVNYPDPDLTVIMLTAHADLQTALNAFRYGANDYMTKPLDLQEVSMKVDGVLEKCRLRKMERNYRELLQMELQAQNERNRLFFFEAVQALVNAIEAKDDYTKGHSLRVTGYAVTYSQHKDLPFDEASRIQLAGKLHDIGKLGIRNSILNKPDKLTDAEFETIKNHPITSYMILQPIMDDDVLRIILHHHERWDGKGYPHGLEKNRIPLGARIVCLADSFDAMTSDRAYRNKMSVEEAIRDIEKNSGTQFDPECARQFIEMISSRSSSELTHLSGREI